MLQWFIRFPEFAEFSEFPFHLGKTPIARQFEVNIRLTEAKAIHELCWNTH